MSILAILGLIFGIVGTAASVGMGAMQNKTNKELTEQTNEANLQAVRETNQSNVEQAELAYQRSLPTAQVRNLMFAGMSKPAALASLSGGGTYTAPVLQAGHSEAPQMDFSNIMSSIERLENIPSSMAQHQLQQEQLNAIKVDTYNKEQEERRKQELHEFDVWSRMYGKETATKLDAASNLIMNSLQSSGRDIGSFKSYEDLIRSLGLSNSKELRDLPSIARHQLFGMVKDKFAEYREQRDLDLREREQNNRDKEQKNRNILALDTLKNSEFGRSLTAKQINKIEAEAERAWQDVESYDEATDARRSENDLRKLQADYGRLMSSLGIAESDWKNSQFYYIDKDGNIQLSALGKQKKAFSEAWKFAATFFGIDILKDILSGLIRIGS